MSIEAYRVDRGEGKCLVCFVFQSASRRMKKRTESAGIMKNSYLCDSCLWNASDEKDQCACEKKKTIVDKIKYPDGVVVSWWSLCHSYVPDEYRINKR